jgi:hypothetical protein
LPLVLYGRETWSFTLREDHRPGVFENTVLKEIFGLTGSKKYEAAENCIMRRFITYTLHQI